MKILVDVNIFMDVYERRADWVDSLAVIHLCQQNKLGGFISALTIPILYFLRRRSFSENQAREDTLKITEGMQVIPLTSEIINQASQSPLPDFEDNIQLFSAEQIAAAYLITRNKKDFVQSKIPIASPKEFLKIVSLQ